MVLPGEITMNDQHPQKGVKKNKRTVEEIQTQVDWVIDQLHKGVPPHEIRKIFYATIANTPHQSHWFSLWKNVIQRLDLINRVPVQETRQKFISGYESDLIQAYNKFIYYENQPDRQANALATKWFEIYLKIKQELSSFYPNLKPTNEDKGEISVQFIQATAEVVKQLQGPTKPEED